MDLKKLSIFLKENDIPAFRLNQVRDAVYKNFAASWDEIPVLPAALRDRLKHGIHIHSVEPVETQISKKKDAIKFCFELKDGLKIESVLLKLMSEKWSLCVSTQVGCPVRCPFCATGKKGLKRNLSPDEISDQFLAAAHYLKTRGSQKIGSVILMGMGEPFLNYDSVAEAMRTMADPVPDSVSIIDVASRRETRRVAVGQVFQHQFVAVHLERGALAVDQHARQVEFLAVEFQGLGRHVGIAPQRHLVEHTRLGRVQIK